MPVTISVGTLVALGTLFYLFAGGICVYALQPKDESLDGSEGLAGFIVLAWPVILVVIGIPALGYTICEKIWGKKESRKEE